MKTSLLDGNVLVAMFMKGHVHHDAASAWLGRRKRFATCPITQGTLIRLLMRNGVSGTDAAGALRFLTEQKRHEFWADELGYDAVELDKLLGHRQVTDAYLAELARWHKAKLVTLDSGLAAIHGDVVELLGDDGEQA